MPARAAAAVSPAEPRRRGRLLLALVGALLVVGLTGPAAGWAVDPPDPLASGPYGVNRVEYNVGTLQLTVTSLGQTCTGSSCSVTAPGSLGYGDSTHDPGNTFPQPMEGSMTWPQGDPPPGGWKTLLFLHGRHNPCKNSSGGDGSSQPWSTGICQFGAWPSWQGYDYLSNLLASWGYAVISVDASSVTTFDNAGTPNDAGATARAEIIAQSLDLLYKWGQEPGPAGVDSNLIGKLDFSKVGIMGHSRGGEGVTQFIEYNRQRPEPARRYNLQAVFSLAPIDRNKHHPVGTNYAVLLPACDGDVSTIAGANAFERGKYANLTDPFNKYQYYVEGTDHNFYNQKWGSDDRGNGELACSQRVNASTVNPTNVRLTRPQQEKTGLATIATFLRVYVGNELSLAPWLTGDLGLPASACPDYSEAGSAAAGALQCQDIVKYSWIAPYGQRQDVVRPASADRPTTANPVSPDSSGGYYRGSGFSLFEWCNPDPFVPQTQPNPPASQGTATAIVPCPGPTSNSSTTTANAFNVSFGPQLALAWDGPAKLTAELRGNYRDVTAYRELSLRAGLQVTETTVSSPAGGPVHQPRNGVTNGWDPLSVTQDIEIALIDRAGHEKAVKLTDFNRPIESPLGNPATNGQPRHTTLNGFEIPLSAYANDVDLTSLDRIELRFGGPGMPRTTGAIQLADLAFQGLGGPFASPLIGALQSPLSPPAATTPLPGDTQLPLVQAQMVSDTAATAGGGGGAAKADEDAVAPVAPATTSAPSSAATAKCTDATAPTIALRTVSRRTIAGTAADAGCATSKVEHVIVTVSTKVKGGKCRFLAADGTLTKKVSCAKPLSLSITSTGSWKVTLPKDLPTGSYTIKVQAVDTAGNLSSARTRTLKA